MRRKALLAGALTAALVAVAVAVASSIGSEREDRVAATHHVKEVDRDRIRGPDLRLWTNLGADVNELRRRLDVSADVERYALDDLSRVTLPVQVPVMIDMNWASAESPAARLMDDLEGLATPDVGYTNIEALRPSPWREWDVLVLIDVDATARAVAAIEQRIAGDDRVEAWRRVSSSESYEFLHEMFPDEPIDEHGAAPMVYVRVRSTTAPGGLAAEIQAFDHVVEDGVILAPRYTSWWE